jgi:transcriptional regulator EpsA
VYTTKNPQGLTAEESGLFIELFEASLRINQREQFFSWLQGSFQFLFPHEVLLCAIRPENEERLNFESFISTRYMTDHQVNRVTQGEDAMLLRGIASWECNQRPIFIADGLSAGDFGSYSVPFVEAPGVLQEVELLNIAAHGMAKKNGEVITFFCFSRIPAQLNAKHAYILELMVPHLHAVLMRISGMQHKHKSLSELRWDKSLPPIISGRELEVLKWMQSGKTNAEIATILNISPMTVKNHVHNVLRKLGVENRNNACSKGVQLGLL